ncbi:Eco57I restriction-modification methylase domain-containing protein [Clostridium sporogenes]|uniref:Eco57I restriction-modification methylase domain-containing protein n=1 Tax=Clostridium sporogenes TaxID=1509 RepID=UPI00313E4926
MNLTKLNEVKSYPIRDNSDILNILLKDRTTRKNIIWATNSYKDMGKGYYPEDYISQESLKVRGKDIIKPRVEKDYEEQINRTRGKGEVFTPSWVIKKKIDLIEEELLKLDLRDYVSKKWLEVACGEAPYIVNRYDAVTGNYIEIDKRVGFLDRKLQKISEEIDDEEVWFCMVKKAYQASYGYEYQGDSLLIARENLLNSFIDYYVDKFSNVPKNDKIEAIAKIISYNIFQMDGLKYTVPILRKIKVEKTDVQLNFFTDMEKQEEQLEIVVNKGKDVEIMDWLEGKTIKFKNLFKCKGGKENMKFDVVIGNPPYHETIENRGEQPSIYNKFMESSYKITDIACFITPARFLFNVGSTPKKWNKKMLCDNHIKIVFFNQNSYEVFPTTDIKGGIVITYRDIQKDYGPIGVFTKFTELNSILKKVEKSLEGGTISELLYSNTSYKYSEYLFEDYPEFDGRLSGGSRRYATSSVFDVLPEIFFDEKPDDKKEYIQILGRQDSIRKFKYVLRRYFADNENLDKFKVFVPSSNGNGQFGEVLSTPLVGKPLVGATETFISFGAFDNEDEAINLLKYIKTKFTRTMLGILKVTQGNKTKHVWSKVPLQDFTPDSDIDWTKSIPEIDQQLYKKYGLNEEEINFIESNVKEME